MSKDHFFPKLSTTPEIMQLYQSKKALLSSENFLEAQSTVMKIEELKRKQQEEALKELKEKQKTDQQIIEKAFEDELRVFNETWDLKIQREMERHRMQQQMLSETHKQVLFKETKRLEDSTPNKYRPSPKVLQLMNIKRRMAKSEILSDAERIRLKIEEKKTKEFQIFSKKRNVFIQNKIAAVESRLNRQVESLHLKQSNALEELKIKRNEEYKKLTRKFLNVKREMTIAQNIATNKTRGHLRASSSVEPGFLGTNTTSYRSLAGSPLKTAKKTRIANAYGTS